MEKEWSAEEQRIFFKRLGYNASYWDPDNEEEVAKLAHAANNALLCGLDANGLRLTDSERNFLSTVVGRY